VWRRSAIALPSAPNMSAVMSSTWSRMSWSVACGAPMSALCKTKPLPELALGWHEL
jgi:hypothetical protein